MCNFAEMTLSQCLELIASPRADAGGGTTVLLAAAMGVSLYEMALKVTQNRPNHSEPEKIKEYLEALKGASKKLLDLAAADGRSYEGVLVAKRLPKEDAVARNKAICSALVKAVSIPLEAAEVCLSYMVYSGALLNICSKVTHTDIASGTFLLSKGITGSLLNVGQNCAELSKFEKTLSPNGDGCNQSSAVLLDKAQKINANCRELVSMVSDRMEVMP